MAPILLTGAGFSRNWGGWLANEAFEYLVGCPEVTPNIKNVLWKNKLKSLGFEGALQDLRAEFAKHQEEFFKNQLAAYEQMLVGMFHSMNIGFQESDFEPARHELSTRTRDHCGIRRGKIVWSVWWEQATATAICRSPV
jgi:hypothetical protein